MYLISMSRKNKKNKQNNLTNTQTTSVATIIKPDTINPEVVSPETMSPETMNPETMNPETMTPETMTPETMSPETMSPRILAQDSDISATTQTNVEQSVNNDSKIDISISTLMALNNALHKELVQKNTLIDKLRNDAITLHANLEHNQSVIHELYDSNDYYKELIDYLGKRVDAIDSETTERIIKNTMFKYLVAMQDFNNRYLIEKSICKDALDSLIKLKKNKNISNCTRYCDKNCNDVEANERFTQLFEKLRIVQDPVRNLIDTNYPNLINGFLSLPRLRNFKPSEDSLKEIDEWWCVF